MATVLFTGRTAPTGRRFQRALASLDSDISVNWTGAPADTTLNGFSRTHKMEQLEILAASGVLVPHFIPADASFPYISPIPGYMPRTNYHTRAGDFRRRPRPDFWVEPLLLSEEKRLHVWKRPQGSIVTIRTAVKLPAPGKETHPWVRSHATGWNFSYIGGSTPAERAVATAAVDALGLDFGAVDLALFCGKPLVLEVNTCPSLEEGGTLSRYVEEVKRWA